MSTEHRGQESKLSKLADSIVENGYDALEPLLIMEAGDGQYVVKEGNRRLAVLKMLLNPRMIPREFTDLRERFQKDHDKVDLNKFRRVPCSITDTNNAIRIVERRHTGERGGAGVVSWGNIEGARFMESSGRKVPELNILDEIVAHGQVSEEARTAYYHNDFPLTNLRRLIVDQPTSRERLGISLKDRGIAYIGDKEKIVKALSIIIDDIATKEINVNDIYYKQDAKVYLDKKIGDDVSLADTSIEPTIIMSPAIQGDEPSLPSESVDELPPLGEVAKKKSSSRKKKMTGLIPPSTEIEDFHNELKAQALFDELKRLDLDGNKLRPGFKYSVSIAYRSFVELSADAYASRHGIPLKSPDPRFKNKERERPLMDIVADVCRDLLKRYKSDPTLEINEDALNCAIRLHSQSNKENFLLMTELNFLVHDRGHHPNIDGLRTLWKEMEGSILAMWRYM